MNARALAVLFVAAGLGLAATAARASDQILLTPVPATLSAGTTAQLQLSVQLDTIPFGGYLFTVNYDTRALTLISLGQAQAGEFQDEFYQGPGAAAGSFTFQGLNDKSLLGPTGSANLAIAVFQATSSTAPFGASGVLTSTVTVTAREGVSTNGSAVAVFAGSTNFQVLGDTIPPVTSLAVSTGAQFIDGAGQLYVASTTLLGFSAADSAAGTFPPSGVAETDYRVDASTPSAAFQRFAAPFALPEGVHLIEFRSIDGSGNVERTRSVTVKVDATPPLSQIAYSTQSFVGASSRTFVSGATAISFAAQDPASGGVASGLAGILFRLDASTPTVPFQAFASTFSLAGGSHSIDFRAFDNVGNLEATHSQVVFADTAPPMTSLLVDGVAAASTSSVVIVSSDVLSFGASDAASGVQKTLFALDGAAAQVYASTFTLSVGTHTLAFQSADSVGNLEPLRFLALRVGPADVLPPRTSLSVGAPSFSSAMLFATDVTTFGLTAVDDRAVVGDATGVGVAQSLIAVDTTSYSVYSGTFSFDSEGAHSLLFYSVDQAANSEAPNSSQVAIDLTAPISQLFVNGSSVAVGGTVVISSATPLSLAAADPVSAGVASGLDNTFYTIDVDPTSSGCQGAPVDPSQPAGTCANEGYAGRFTLAVGSHTVYFLSVDSVGNQEEVNVASFTVLPVDVLPPRTSLVIGQPSAGANPTYITPATALSLQAVDDRMSVGDGSGVGVARTLVALDTATFSVYTGTFSFAASGQHSVSYYSADLAGNVEAPHATTVAIDGTPPSLSLSPATWSALDVTTPTITASYADSGAGVNLASFRLTLDGVDVSTLAVVTASSATFVPSTALSQGTHTVTAVIADGVGNSTAAASRFRIVTTPPVSTLVAGSPQFSSSTLFISSFTPLGFATSRWAHVSYSIDGSSYSLFTTSFTLAAVGKHVIQYYAVDRAGNVEAVRTSSMAVDGLPPQTAFVLGSPSFSSGTLYGTDQSTVTLVATDDLAAAGDHAGSGIERTLISVDSAAAVLYSGGFTLNSEGAHSVTFYSVDQIGNAEAARSTQVSIDLTAPVSQLQFVGTRTTDAKGNPAVSTAAVFSISAIDPVSGGVVSGVGSIFYVIDADPFSPACEGTALDPTQPSGSCANEAYNGPFSLLPGPHTVYFFAEDNVGNQEEEHVSSFTVDGLPPRSALVIGTPQFGSNPTYVSSGTALGIAAADDLATARDGGGIGLASAYVAVDSAPFAVATGSFSLTAQGPHSVQFYSVDRIGNSEAIRSAQVDADVAPPSTLLLVDGGLAAAGPLLLVSTDTLAFSASDVGSGVQAILYSIDGGTVLASTSSFSLTVGTHTVSFQSRDNVANLEPGHVVAATVRAPVTTAPSLSLIPANGAVMTVTTPTMGTVYAAAPGATVASVHLVLDGVDVTTRAVVTASSATFIPSGLSQGQHALNATVGDNYGNVASSTATFTVDSLPPVTTLLVDGAPVSSQSIVAAVSDTFTLTAIDAGTGVNRTLYSLDGAVQLLYTAGLSLAPGQHTVSFLSADNAGNVESLKSVAILVRAPMAPPTVAIVSPDASGFSAEVKGLIPVLGTVNGQALLTWKLEVASGQNPLFGYAQIASGSLPVDSGLLGTWNASAASGWQTLRLSAANANGQTSSVMHPVYVGDPSLALELDDLKLPEAVAVGPSGFIYVADTGNDRVEVFTPQGRLSTTFGSGGDHDDHSRQSLSFSKPQGIASDIFGNIYVSDTGNRRILKLTSLGTIIMQIPVQGKPSGIAVDRAGLIYVSDGENGQIVKFNQIGSKQLTFMLPAGKPAGVAVDTSGRLYVADAKKKRLAVFAPDGTLLASWTNALLERPYGVAVDSAGASIVVSDQARDGFLKFDAVGDLLFSYGGRKSGLGAPRGLAFDSAGMLYLAERTKNRVIKIGPPAPGTAPAPIANKLALLGEDQAFITASVGGVLRRSDHASFVAPPGVLPDDMDVTLSTPAVRLAAEEALKNRKLDGDGLISVSTGVALGPDGLKLLAPAYVVVPYDSPFVTSLGVADLTLKLYWWNPDKQDWQWNPSRVNPMTHTVSGPVVRLGHFKVVVRRDDVAQAAQRPQAAAVPEAAAPQTEPAPQSNTAPSAAPAPKTEPIPKMEPPSQSAPKQADRNSSPHGQ